MSYPNKVAMELRVNMFIYCLIMVFVLFVNSVCAMPSYDSALESPSDSDKLKDPLWFGPRLGRRKRNQHEANSKTDLETQQITAILEVIKDTPWTILAVNDGKNTQVYHQDASEDMDFKDNRWDDNEEFLTQRSPPFAPRLGRRQTPFVPRLGRETPKMNI